MSEVSIEASVIMSIYNETVEEMLVSINSIVNQTFKNIEVILINDNPKRKKEIKEALSELLTNNKLFKLYHNETNIGLAMSMNRAADLAKSEILIRMDADDICEEERFGIIINEIYDHQLDLVCSRYSFVDENGNDMGKVSPYYADETICEKLQKWNVIHHPTVVMRKEIFIKAGKYRDFPCSQDYDLWLRMSEITSRIRMVDNVLLKYRVRANSISSQKSMQQLYTIEYIKKLAKERRKNGNDSYSIENYQNYLRKNGVFDEKRKRAFERHNLLHKQAQKEMKNGNKIIGLWHYAKAILGEKVLFKQMLERKF